MIHKIRQNRYFWGEGVSNYYALRYYHFLFRNLIMDSAYKKHHYFVPTFIEL